MDNRSNMLTPKKAIMAAAAVGIISVVIYNRARLLERLRRYGLDSKNPLPNKRIRVIETADECQRAVNDLRKEFADRKVLGFACEWVTVGGSRRPVAMLQLSSREGLCALFRICCMKQIPKSLRELLEDDEVLKVGVAPRNNAQKLWHDYGVFVASILDIHYLAAMAGHMLDGLPEMAKTILNVKMDKISHLACDWDAKILSKEQMHYAANSALVALKIHEKLCLVMNPRDIVNTIRIIHMGNHEPVWLP